MEQKIGMLLGSINRNPLGVTLEVNGDRITFSYDSESGTYTMSTNGREQGGLSLNELIVILNRPILQQAIEEKYQDLLEEGSNIRALRTKYFAMIDSMPLPDDRKEVLKMLVRQITLPGTQIGFGNRVPFIDKELEARRQIYMEHKDEFDRERKELMEKAGEYMKMAEGVGGDAAVDYEAEAEEIWKKIEEIPSQPDVISQDIRLGGNGEIQLVTELDGPVTFHDHEDISIEEINRRIDNGDEIKIDPELIKQYDNDDYLK